MNTYQHIDANGRIYATETRPELIVAVEEAFDPDIYYYDYGIEDFLPRESMPLIVVDTTITGIPVASIVTVVSDNGTQTFEASGEITLTADLPGTANVTVTNLQRRWLDTTVEVTIP